MHARLQAIKVLSVQTTMSVRRGLPASIARPAAVTLLWTAACQLTLDNPTPPNTTELEARYDSPPGRLTAGDVERVVETFRSQDELLRETDSLQLVVDLLDSVSTNEAVIDNGDQVDSTRGARVLAVAQATRVCRGPEADAVIDPQRFGVARMTLKGSPRGILPVTWGRFEDCVDHTQEGEAFEIDGEYSLTVREGSGRRSLLFVFRGTIESMRLSFDGALDFRLLGDGTPELRVSTVDGDVIVALSLRGELIVRDSSGTWRCEPVTLSCENTSSGESIQPEQAP